MSVPRVSVLMTTHNGVAWLRPSLHSVLAQTLTEFELVVVDDASTDGTAAILAEVPDKRLRVIRPGRNLGIAGARNAGLAECRAPYVAVLDHDDLSLPGRLAAQAAFLDGAPGCVMVGTAVEMVRDGAVLPSGQPARVGPDGLRLLLHLGNPLTWSSMMFRRSALAAAAVDGEVLRQGVEPADDFDLYHRLLAQGGAARLGAVLTRYRWHATNTSHRVGKVIADRAAAVLARAYAPWFGAEAEAAARLMIRHVSDREPVTDADTLDRVLGVIGTVAGHVPSPEGARLARAARWGVLRAVVRGGRPDLLVRRWRHAPPGMDAAVSATVGTVRWLRT